MREIVGFDPTTKYTPPLLLKNGLIQTVYIALWMDKQWEKTTKLVEPEYKEHIFIGANDVPIFGIVAIPHQSYCRGTIIGTYGITGDLENQWFLRLLGRKAYAQGYAVVLFDWRAHGKTAQLSPTLTSDGLYEGEDFVRIAAQAKKIGCPSKFWFTGYSLGGKLALWGIAAASNLSETALGLGLEDKDIGGCGVICPSLDAWRSLLYLEKNPLGRYLEKKITQSLKDLAYRLYEYHPKDIDPKVLQLTNSIREFDQYLVIPSLGFETVADYYYASSPFRILSKINKPTIIIYAQDDPMFDPTIIQDLQLTVKNNQMLDLILTKNGGHVGYISSYFSQNQSKDPDRWWAWNRFLKWLSDKY